MDEIKLLFDEIDKFPYPDTMTMAKGEINKRAFFPGGKGTFGNGNIISDKDCQKFFLNQIELQKPKAIFELGKFTAIFLADLSEKLNCWKKIKNFATLDKNKYQITTDVVFQNEVKSNLVLLTHPSYRHANVWRRKYGSESGPKAEIDMIQAIL